MFIIDVNKKEVIKDLPEVKSWIRKIKNLTLKKQKIDNSKIEFFYSYGFFSRKSEKNEDYYIKLSELTSVMLYNERLDYELKKVRVELTIKIDNFSMTDRLPKGVIPEMIYKIVSEITKVKMLVESEYHKNEDVINSIPALDRENFDIKIVRETIEEEYSDNPDLDMDIILDKISKEGIESLSTDEKEFLDKKSKDI
jgi:hypothetical protein